MNSHVECKEFDIKHEEDDPLSITQIKIEPQVSYIFIHKHYVMLLTILTSHTTVKTVDNKELVFINIK